MQFDSVSVLLPVMNETESLRKTVATLEETCRADVREFIFVVCDRTAADSVAICRSFHLSDPGRFVVHTQTLPFLGGAIREGFALARATHVIMMASDLETDPNTVPLMIEASKRRPDAIITTSRWTQGGGFDGYNQMKLLANFIFQKTFSVLYRTKLSDMTYGFRLFPTALVKSIHWEELRHPFLFETLIKPLRLGVPVEEIPTSWKARVEGASQNTFMRNFSYFGVGLRTLVYSESRIKNETSHRHHNDQPGY
jgi:glycosyltransferase involved in cell wall biosynthesis